MRQHRRGILIGVLASVLAGALLATPLLLVHRSDLPFERAYGNAVVALVSRALGGDAKNPVAGNSRATTAGRYTYTGSCVACHGATGEGRGLFGQTTDPAATDLRSEDGRAKSDAQLFWITKNGLSFTGMPGFGGQYTDQDLWSIVSYLRLLQQGRSSAIGIPAPTAAQLAVADPSSPNATGRGAAVYFAQGCQLCHGAVGDAPGELALHEGETEAIRRGRAGMPAYRTDAISASQLADLLACLRTFAREGGRD